MGSLELLCQLSSWCTGMGEGWATAWRSAAAQQRVLAAVCSQILPNASWDAEQLCAPAAFPLLTGLSVEAMRSGKCSFLLIWVDLGSHRPMTGTDPPFLTRQSSPAAAQTPVNSASFTAAEPPAPSTHICSLSTDLNSSFTSNWSSRRIFRLALGSLIFHCVTAPALPSWESSEGASSMGL